MTVEVIYGLQRIQTIPEANLDGPFVADRDPKGSISKVTERLSKPAMFLTSNGVQLRLFMWCLDRDRERFVLYPRLTLNSVGNTTKGVLLMPPWT